MDSPASPPAAAARRSRIALWTALAALLLAAAVTAAAVSWLWHSTAGLQAIVRVVDRLLPVRLAASGLHGSLAAGFGAARVVVEVGSTRVEVERLDAHLADLRLGLTLDAVRLDFDRLSAERVAVRVTPSGAPATPPPASIAAPLHVSARRLAVGAFELVTGTDASPGRLAARAIDAGMALGPAGYRVDDGRFSFGADDSPLQATVAGTLGGAAPFAVEARGSLATQWRTQPLQARFVAGGSLLDLQLAADVDGGEARGSLRATVHAFEPPALRRLAADLRDLDPAAWVRDAPQARLAVQADLQPVGGASFTLAGPVRIDNAAPGTLDAGRLPLRALRAQVRLNAQQLEASDLSAELARGSAAGRFALRFGTPLAWDAALTLAGVDPAALHARAQPLLLDGSAQARSEGSRTEVQADVRNRRGVPAQLKVDLALDAERAVLNSARLALGPGVAALRGELEFGGRRGVRLAGTVTEFDPSLLVRDLAARLTGTLVVDAALAPQPTGIASFALSDSQAFGRPLTGRGVISLAPDRTLNVDAVLGVRSATLTANGGLGAADRVLTVAVDAPELAELGLPLQGRAALQARLQGDWQAPAVDAQIEVERLRHGDHAVDKLQAVGRYGGGRDGALALQATLSNHRFRRNPVLSLRSATLAIDGRLPAHRLTLAALNEETQPVDLVLAGGWSETARAWRGEVQRARAGTPFDLELLATAPVETDFRRWALGPAALTLVGARVEDVAVEVGPNLLSTRGRFTGLQPARLRGMADTPLLRPADRQPLTLQGQWQLRFGAQADGSLLIERSSGDLYAGRLPMGLDTARFDLALRANRLQARAALHGERAGRIDAEASAEVESTGSGWRLAQQRPLAAQASADLPSIGWVNSLLGEATRANLRLGGRASGTLRLTGTPAEPQAEGSVRGDDLRVAWVEQGVRLDGGTLAARVSGSEIVVDELRFNGTTPAPPADRRTAAAAERSRREAGVPGFVAVNGRLQLRDLAGVLQVRAERMPFLQRPDRWALATGGANIVFDRRLVQLNGAVAVNAGFVDFTRADLPSLSSDVRVLRSAEPAAAREAPIGFALDLGIDLGPAFWLRGTGLDTRVEGALRLRSDGRGAIRATGAVEAIDGVYEGFGQKLTIARGRVNFQGPIENPGLDILALRRGLPVEVGVSITRTAADPLVKLHADEPMADFQILSWLVLGRPADEEGGADRTALARAAAGLLTGTGEGIPTQLARRLGIDEVSLRAGDLSGGAGSLLPRQAVAGVVRGTPGSTVAGDIVTIGKRVGDAISVSYEQAIGGAASVVQVSYQVSRRVSVIARAGTENALDLVYTIAFD